MNNHTFISYTIRDGYITNDLLTKIKRHFELFGSTYVDILDNDSVLKQERVFYELDKADSFVLLETPAIHSSPWVKLEIEKAQKLNLQIINLGINEIENISKNNRD